MERKGRTTIRRQRRSRSWLFSPMIIAQLAVVMVVAGVGVAFAMPTATISPTLDPWAGTASIDSSAHVDVDDYTLTFNSALNAVDKITLAGTCSAAGTTATLKWAILDGGSYLVGGEITQPFAATWSIEIDLSPDRALDAVDTLNVIVTE